MAVISAQEFKNKAVSIISIPGFQEGETFEIKVKNLSIVGLISAGKIPNALMQTVKNAFAGIKSSASTKEAEASVIDKAEQIGNLLDIVCKEAMVEPLFDEVKDVMNDSQKLAVFSFTQGGVQELEPFLSVEGDTRPTDDVEDISGKTE